MIRTRHRSNYHEFAAGLGAALVDHSRARPRKLVRLRRWSADLLWILAVIAISFASLATGACAAAAVDFPIGLRALLAFDAVALAFFVWRTFRR